MIIFNGGNIECNYLLNKKFSVGIQSIFLGLRKKEISSYPSVWGGLETETINKLTYVFSFALTSTYYIFGKNNGKGGFYTSLGFGIMRIKDSSSVLN